MTTTTQKPLLEVDVDHIVLTGNRSGLEQLRESITRLLDDGGQSVLINDGNTGIELIVLDETLSDDPIHQSWKDRILMYALLTILISVLLTTLFATLLGFYQLLKIFN